MAETVGFSKIKMTSACVSHRGEKHQRSCISIKQTRSPTTWRPQTGEGFGHTLKWLNARRAEILG